MVAETDAVATEPLAAWLGEDAVPPQTAGALRPGQAQVLHSLHQVRAVLAGWTDADEALNAVDHVLAAAPASSSAAPGERPVRGHITDCPVYCALWAQPVHAFESLGRRAQATLIAAIAELGDTQHRAAYASAVRNAALSVRRLGEGKNLPSTLIPAIETARSLKDVLAALDAVSTGKGLLGSQEERRLIDGLKVLVKDAVEKRSARRRTATASGVRRARGNAERQFDDPTPIFQEYAGEEGDRPAAAEIHEAAAPCPESPRRRLATLPIESEVPGASLSPAQRQYRAVYRARAIASAAQQLLLGSDRLHLVDLMAAEAVARQSSGSTPEEVRKGLLVVAASLLTGRPFAELEQVPVVRSLADLSRKPRLAYLTATPFWVLPVPKLPEAFTASTEEADLYRPVERRLSVRMPTSLTLFSRLAEHASGLQGRRLFEGREWPRDAQAFVSYSNERFGSRLTLARIAAFLERQALAMSGDHAMASILAGTDDSSARRYYYTPACSDLEARYEAVWEAVTRGVTRTGRLQTPTSTGAQEPPGPYVGSESCPTDAAVKSMVAGLIEFVDAQRRGRRDIVRRRMAHNALTVYTVAMIQWHTGIRAVADPVDLAQYDDRLGLLAVSDKDSDAYHSSRVLPLLSLLQAQIAHYREHLQALGEVVPEGWNDRLFLFDGDGKVHAVTPKRMREVRPASYRFRDNAQRHYLRTRLIELGALPQAVDAFLGHAAPGQEAYGRYSCLAPEVIREQLNPRLETLSQSAGWLLRRGERA